MIKKSSLLIQFSQTGLILKKSVNHKFPCFRNSKSLKGINFFLEIPKVHRLFSSCLLAMFGTFGCNAKSNYFILCAF